MGPSEFKRYVTLVRIANFLGRSDFSVSLEQLESYDGVSARRSHEINARLGERGLVALDRSRNPYRYFLNQSCDWAKPGVRMEIRRGRQIQMEKKVMPPPW